MENGEEKYLSLNEKSMLEDYDKIRKENGWKPRKPEAEIVRTPKVYNSSSSNNSGKQSSGSISSSSSKKRTKTGVEEGGGADEGNSLLACPNLTATMTPEQKILARLQAEVQLREQVLAQQQQQQQQQQQEEESRKDALSLRCFRFIREAEKLETAKKEREAAVAKQRDVMEQKKKRQEELAKLRRQEETMKKIQEKEIKRQQLAVAREQVATQVLYLIYIYTCIYIYTG